MSPEPEAATPAGNGSPRKKVDDATTGNGSNGARDDTSDTDDGSRAVGTDAQHSGNGSRSLPDDHVETNNGSHPLHTNHHTDAGNGSHAANSNHHAHAGNGSHAANSTEWHHAGNGSHASSDGHPDAGNGSHPAEWHHAGNGAHPAHHDHPGANGSSFPHDPQPLSTNGWRRSPHQEAQRWGALHETGGPGPVRGHVTIVIPAKDEAEAVGDTLATLPLETLRTAGHTFDVVVLDGKSRDGTAAIARAHGATVLTDRGNGKGSALRDARRHFRGDYVVMLDADGTYAPDAIPRVVDRLARHEADIVMGERRALAGSMSPMHRLGNAALSLGASVLYGRVCPDVCTGLWGFRQSALSSLPLRSRGFELEAEMFALSSRLGLRVIHVPVDYLPRRGPTKLSTTRDGLRIGWCLVRSRFAQVGGGVGAPGRPIDRLDPEVPG